MSLSGSILPDCCGRLMNPDESRGIAEFLIDTESLISFDFDPLSSVDLCLFLQLNNSLLSEELNENSIMTTHDTDSLNNCHLDTEPDEIRCVFLSIETVRYSFAYRESFKQPIVLPEKISPHSEDDEEVISALEAQTTQDIKQDICFWFQGGFYRTIFWDVVIVTEFICSIWKAVVEHPRTCKGLSNIVVLMFLHFVYVIYVFSKHFFRTFNLERADFSFDIGSLTVVTVLFLFFKKKIGFMTAHFMLAVPLKDLYHDCVQFQAEDLLHRNELHHAIDDCTGVNFVSGPSGSGKHWVTLNTFRNQDNVLYLSSNWRHYRPPCCNTYFFKNEKEWIKKWLVGELKGPTSKMIKHKPVLIFSSTFEFKDEDWNFFCSAKIQIKEFGSRVFFITNSQYNLKMNNPTLTSIFHTVYVPYPSPYQLTEIHNELRNKGCTVIDSITPSLQLMYEYATHSDAVIKNTRDGTLRVLKDWVKAGDPNEKLQVLKKCWEVTHLDTLEIHLPTGTTPDLETTQQELLKELFTDRLKILSCFNGVTCFSDPYSKYAADHVVNKWAKTKPVLFRVAHT
ncbi:hypothetical protein RCL1_007170 [Eukaryota sp. TZLM3-RCL]